MPEKINSPSFSAAFWKHGRKERSLVLDYHVGDRVIHANYGMGEIIQMDEKFIHERRMLCYVVQIHDLVVWVMADEPGKSSLRLPTSSSDFDGVYAILRSPGEPLPIERFERKKELAERMKRGSLASICTVIRDLALYKHQKKFNDDDKTIMKRAQDFLLEEWVYALSVSWMQAYDELTRLLGVVYTMA
jgi:RNA polymerase-interacting CarD/CdnL/TRCF family regulator